MKTLTNNEMAEVQNELRKERTLKNIARRAATLLADGYTATQTMAGQFVTCYQVLSPKGDRYAVKVSKAPAAPGSFYGSRCSCPCFADMTTCKHLQALELQEAEDANDAAQIAEYERRSEWENYCNGRFDR